ncbi:hypothetical protein ACU4GD_18425 [Cupriavidus basilensis]
MPTVFSLFGLRVVIYPERSQAGARACDGKGCEAVFNLHRPGGPPELRENYGFGASDLGRIVDGLTTHLAALCSEWRSIHGLPY